MKLCSLWFPEGSFPLSLNTGTNVLIGSHLAPLFSGSFSKMAACSSPALLVSGRQFVWARRLELFHSLSTYHGFRLLSLVFILPFARLD